MKYTYKNAQENTHGSIDCEILLGDEWVPHTQDPSNEYDLSEESEWQDIKPCDQEEKDAHEQAEVRTGMLAELIALDVSPRTIEDALLGDEYALTKIREANNKKAELRKGL